MTISKAVILAAGKGTRMLPITMKKPKPLVSVAGKPFLYFLINNLLDSGITEIGIVMGYRKEQIVDFVEENFPDEDITLIEQEEQLGTGHALMCAKEFIGEDEFIVVMSDNLYSVNDLKKFQNTNGNTYVSAFRHEHPERYGLILEDDGLLVEVIEKPENVEPGAKINAGLYKFSTELFTVLGKINPSLRGELELTDAVNLLAKSGEVKIIDIEDFWLDLARPEDIFSISQFLQERQ